MKRILYFFSVMLCILAVTGCQDRDIIDFKDGVSLPPVTDLKSSLTPDNDAVLESGRDTTSFIRLCSGLQRGGAGASDFFGR